MTITDFGRRSVNLLFARLVLALGVEQGRDELALWLWPEIRQRRNRLATELTAIRRSRLRHELHELRDWLELPGYPRGAVLQARRAGIRLNPEAVDCDVSIFEAHLRRGETAEALRTWRGDLLPGVDDDWIEAHRTRLTKLRRGLIAGTPRDSAEPTAAPLIYPYATAFFGREGEIAKLTHALSEHRLVVISGAGGVGKTRLAVQVAAAVAPNDFKAMVLLSDCARPAHLFEYVRAALGIERSEARRSGMPAEAAVLEQLTTYLAGRPALLVLDNVEQLAGSEFVAALEAMLDAMPLLRLLLTSRLVLRQAPALNFSLRPLPLPGPEEIVGHSDGAHRRLACVALYENRAQAARADFRVHRRNFADVLALCKALGGMPLLVEIAAARVRDFPPSRLLVELAEGIEVLGRPGHRARRDGRHASVAAMLKWTWQHLDASARHALSALTVFQEGATVAGWRAVSGDPTMEARGQLLMDWSLLQMETADDRPLRYRLLPLVREFVAKATPGADMRSLELAHRDFFSAKIRGGEFKCWDERDTADSMAAIRHAMRQGAPAEAVSMALGLGNHWLARGTSAQALDVLRELSGHVDLDTPGAPALRALLPRLLMSTGHVVEANFRARQALEAAGEEPTFRAPALLADAQIAWYSTQDDDAALGPAQEALHLARQAGLVDVERHALLLLGALKLQVGDVAGAQALFNEADRLFRRDRDARGALLVLPGLVSCLMERRRFASAIRLALVGLEEAEAQGDVAIQMRLCDRLAVSHEARRDASSALAICQRQVRLAYRHGLAYSLAFALWNQCDPLLRTGQAEAAVTLMAYTARYWNSNIGTLSSADITAIDRLRREARRRLTSAREAELWAAGGTMGHAEAVLLGSG